MLGTAEENTVPSPKNIRDSGKLTRRDAIPPALPARPPYPDYQHPSPAKAAK